VCLNYGAKKNYNAVINGSFDVVISTPAMRWTGSAPPSTGSSSTRAT